MSLNRPLETGKMPVTFRVYFLDKFVIKCLVTLAGKMFWFQSGNAAVRKGGPSSRTMTIVKSMRFCH